MARGLGKHRGPRQRGITVGGFGRKRQFYRGVGEVMQEQGRMGWEVRDFLVGQAGPSF